jgi:PAS domain S-box-containing protein
MNDRPLARPAGKTERRSGRDRRSPERFHLTDRETEVLALVLRGLENKEIAAELGVGEQSIKDHVSALLQKFAVPNRAALADAGVRLDLVGQVGLDRAWTSQLFRTAGLSISILRGPELRYVAVNETFRRLAGDRAVIGRTMREVFPDLRGDLVAEVERAYRSGTTIRLHGARRSWDRGQGREPHVVDGLIQPLRDEDGTVNGVAVFGIDVTDLVEAGG